MNVIIMSRDCISAFSSNIEAECHKHMMLQLFISSKGSIEVEVEGKCIEGACIVVERNTNHKVKSNGNELFTMLIKPLTETDIRLRNKFFREKSYCILQNKDLESLQNDLLNIHLDTEIGFYERFIENLKEIILLDTICPPELDSRIKYILKLLQECNCDPMEHQVKYLADKVSLSVGRISHLFKEKTGITLKGYLIYHQLEQAYLDIFSGNSITQSAMNTGFSTPSHLSYTNKLRTGMSARDILKDSIFLKVADLF